MGNFNRDRGGRSSDRRSGGGFGRRDSRGDSGRPEMFKAICDECGASCELPFKPSNDKPVYCSDCFRGKESSGPRRSGGRDFGRNHSRDREMFKAVCDKCGKDCELPFKPSNDKPVYCSDCFGRENRSSSKSSTNINIEQQLKSINSKLDEILKNFLMSSIKVKDKKEETITKTKLVTKPSSVSKKTKKKIEVKKIATKKVKKPKK